MLKIQKLQTSSYNPQAIGICEKMHKMLIDMISHFVRKGARNWDDYVPMLSWYTEPCPTVRRDIHIIIWYLEER